MSKTLTFSQLSRMNTNRGFAALVSVLILSLGTMAFSLSALGSAVVYADSVRSREIRIQNRLNVAACRETALIMAEKDHFLHGTIKISEFGCTVNIQQSIGGQITAEIVEVVLNAY
jgi:hypothetical protein